MSKLKRVLSVILVVALVAAASVAGTVTYLTDRDSQANVFSVGDVSIRLNGALEDGIALIPGVALGTNITIENTGRNAAWVWMTYAVPAALDASDAKAVQVSTHGAYRNGGYTVEEYYTELGLTAPVAEEDTWLVDEETGEVEINGMLYNIYTHMYKGVVVAGEITNPGITQIYMDGRVDVDPDGNMHLVENGVATDLNWNVNTDGQPVIYVSAYAIQEEGFADVKAAYAAYGQQWGENGYEWADPGVQQPDDGEDDGDDDDDNQQPVDLYELMTNSNAGVYDVKGNNTGKTVSETVTSAIGKEVTFGTVLTKEAIDNIGYANSEMTAEQLRQLCVDSYRLSYSFLWTPKEDVASYPCGPDSLKLLQSYYETYIDPNIVLERGDAKAFKAGTIYAGIPYQNVSSGNIYRILEYYDSTTGELDVRRFAQENGGYDDGEWMDPNVSKYEYTWYEDWIAYYNNDDDPSNDKVYEAEKAGWLVNKNGPKEPLWSEEHQCYYVTMSAVPLPSTAAFIKVDPRINWSDKTNTACIFNTSKGMTVKTVSVDGSSRAVVTKCDDGKWRMEFSTVSYKWITLFGTSCSYGASRGWQRVINSACIYATSGCTPYWGWIPVGLFSYEYEASDGKTYSLDNIVELGANKKTNISKVYTNPDSKDVNHIAKYWIEKNETADQQAANGIGQSIYQLYALAEPADALCSQGHVQMIQSVHVEYLDEAKTIIDPVNSYFVVYESETLGFYGSIVGENGDSAPYYVQTGIVADYDDMELYAGNVPYGARKQSFQYSLFKKNDPTSIENITNPYLPWTFAEFHYGEEDELSKAYVEYWKNNASFSIEDIYYEYPEIITNAGYSLDKNAENSFITPAIEELIILTTMDDGDIRLNDRTDIAGISSADLVNNNVRVVLNAYYTDVFCTIKDQNGNVVYEYIYRPSNHYQRGFKLHNYTKLHAAMDTYSDGTYTLVVEVQTVTGPRAVVYDGAIIASPTT